MYLASIILPANLLANRMIQPMFTPLNIIAAIITLTPFLVFAFFPDAVNQRLRTMPLRLQIAAPALLAIPYILVALGSGTLRWGWFALYLFLPVTVAVLQWQASRIDRDQRGNWRDFLILAVLGLAVDLRWFEGAWPAHLAIFNKILLLDAGIYAFVFVRQLQGIGFDLRLKLSDLRIGLREAAYYTPIALALGLSLGFLHLHRAWPGFAAIAQAWIFTFFFVGVPEELFFRGWLQNLLTRRMGRYPALIVTACLFGLAHFNKRTIQFNWRYVLLAAIAAIFYGRAWHGQSWAGRDSMRERRVGASAVTHATVDALWSLWLR